MGEGGGSSIGCCVTFTILCVITLITTLVALSYKGVEYYELGLVRRKTTGEVFTDDVYEAGHYFIGLDYEFKVFRADAHIIDLKSVSVFTRDRLEVNLNCTFQYFIRSEDLKDLHDTYDIYYEETLQNSAIDALKGGTPDFYTSEFSQSRALIEEALFDAVRKRLGGTCCKLGCDNLPEGCEPGCKKPQDCTQEDKGFYVDVRYFQLRFIEIPNIVLSRNLQTLVQLEDGIQETYIQQAQLVRKTTEERVRDIQNAAEEISQNATSYASLIDSQAKAQARSLVESAHNMGLAQIYIDLNITVQDHKASLNYIRTLRDHPTVIMSVNFNSLITGPVNVYSGGGK